ncbi:hypothetical protein TWF569_007302 [Orbilia oligospora]|uniref:Fatty acid hydroxylase domain-containing protein n=1 Tax=Orbilia oligospora TaxID=2813651 RepID=A0A7C8JF93_ORBOL|nr:hypothetical protein TWF102_010328 [Orbilia oligospora]KAF3097093.1 hypothetical protein TWF103_009622 [Orbilia oligospora]KAF3141833.1 hypothetical protein TWF594_005891 [Orbilia oligospora]KAF3143685.1 hypothetical protein TWF569_007302 [Orbilia oligospora]
MSALIGSLGGLGLLFNNYTASSLNLFFFWMTWTTLIMSHPPLRVELIATFFVRLVFFLLPALVFTLFDNLLPSLAGKEPYVTSKPASRKKVAVPTGRGKKKTLEVSNLNRGTFFAIFMTIGNIMLGIGIQGLLEYIAVDIFRRPRLLKISSTFPYPWDMARGIAYAMLLRELFIYYPHRHIHQNPKSPFHKSHVHPTPTTSSLNLTSTTPIDYVLLQFLPIYIPSVMLSFHLLTYLAFVAITSIIDVVCYSQYEYLPKAFFIGRIARRVRGHDESGGRGGYGWIGLLDWVHGTEIHWNEGGVMGVGGGGEGGEGFTQAVRRGVRTRKASRKARHLDE